VQFAEVVSVLAQWARQSAVIQSHALMFHTFALTGTRFVRHLQWKKLLLFLLNGIAQSVVTRLVATATIHQALK
jgi:hypothetical protein